MLKKLTKVLSLLLIFCLVVSMFPAAALADEGAEDPVVTEVPEETTPVVASDPEVTLVPELTPAPSDPPVDSEPAGDVSADDGSADNDEPGSYILSNPDEGVAVTSLTMGTKPANGTTSGNPFVQGTGGSNSFRIPALVTLSNGTLVAAADARWNTTFDGGGLDTIVSYSTDNGANWNYSFANYLGDNGNVYNGSDSTAFIDPALATDGSTVYMLCDLYPYGVALNGSVDVYPSTNVGFNSDGTLKLAANGSSTYNYYLKDGQIYDSSNNAVSGYTVDAYFNITGNGYNTNLFFSDSPYQVVRTGYLYLTKSTDSGKTWSAPTLIPNVKTSSEQVCLVGPGRGLVTGGKIIFPVYSYNNGNQQMGFIYSSDGGATWTRSANFIGDSWSSEAAVVALKDGTLRFFYRNGNSTLRYVDYSWTNGWGSAVNTGIATNSNTQISAISYSKTVDGKQVILVSCPTGSNSNGSADSSASARLNGRIQIGLVDSKTNTMTWETPIDVTTNNSQFMYSCLTELNDGKVAILYENQESKWGTGDNCYYTMDFQTYDLGLTTDSGNAGDGEGEGEENNDPVTVTDGNSSVSATAKGLTSVSAEKQANATPYTGYTAAVTYRITLNDGAYTESAEIKIPYDSSFDGCNNFIGSVGNDTFAVTVKDNYFIGTAPHFSDVTISGRTVTQEENVTLVVGETSKTYTEAGNYSGNYTAPNASIATIEIKGQDGQEGGVEYTEASVTCDTLISRDTNSSWTAASGYYYTPDGVNYYPVYAKRSSAKQGSLWWQYTQYTYTWGYKNGDSDPTQIGEAQVEGSRTSDGTQATPDITVYTQSTTAAIPASTTFTFTGVSVGTTIAVVGSTQYNITVTRKEVSVPLTVGNTATYTDKNAGSVTVADNTVAEASLTNGELTIKGLKEGTTTVTTATTKYTVTVSDGTPISIKENETTTISVILEDGQTVEWSSADSSYVGVAGKYDTTAGAYTNEAILAGQNVTNSPVVVTATIKDADGNVVRTEKWLVTVTEGDADTNTTTRYIYIEVDTIQNCTVYYSINAGELIPVNGTGVLMNGTTTGHWQITFFAAPDEGYALTYMASTNSSSQYYTLSNGNPDGTGSDAWPFIDPAQTTIPTSNSDATIWKTVNSSLHGFRWALLEGNMTIDQMKVMFSNAIALGCDGILLFTKNGAGTSTDNSSNEKNLHTNLSFVAQKLPTLEKTIKSITHDGTEAAYTDGMKVEIGDTINYSVVVTRYATNATYGTITYNNEKLTDELTNNDGISAPPDMGTSTTSDKTYTYTTSLTLTMDNFADVVKNGKITNTADFSYSYSSQYSSGSLETEASAVAEITVVVPEYVIDFGLPVTIDLSSVLGGAAITGGSASYGAITPSGTSFTYTPDKVLRGVDYVTLTLGNNQTYGVNIYPATTVYYEEGFATYAGSWGETASKGAGTQAAQIAGQSTDEYGYDAKYANEAAGPSNGSQATSITITDAATFSFTGTGVDIYANCTEASGAVNVVIRDSNNALVKLLIINTKTGEGTTGATAGQNTDSYNLPIASVTGLTHGTYTVTVRHSKLTAEDGGNPVSLDGFRVYGTLKDQKDSVYVSDLEDNPTYIELRNEVLEALNVQNISASQYADQVASDIMKQVYDGNGTSTDVETGTKALVLSGGASYSAQDLLDNGPKNEIFLRNGDSLVFKVSTGREVQIGLKAINSAVTCTVNNVAKTITSSTDMFYTVFNQGGASGGKTVTITNNSGGILSITKLKICDDPGATLGELTEEDLIPALVGMGYEPEPEEPVVEYADATLTVEVNGKTEVLTKNGVVGESATFTAAEIEAAAQGLVPDGYELKDQAEDVTVAYGASTTVSLRAEEIPTEPEQPEEPEQPTEPEKPEQPSKPANIVSAVIRLIDRIFGSLKGLFR